MIFEQKDIVLLPFPFSNLEEEKVRPAIIISNNRFNDDSPDCLMIPLTSVLKKRPFSILLSQDDLVCGKLIAESMIRADKIFSLEKSMVKMKIGIVDDKKFKEIIEKVMKLF